MRKVRLKKLAGTPHLQDVSFEVVFEGREKVKPTVGEPYTVLADSGSVLETSPVIKIFRGYLLTETSLYKFNAPERGTLEGLETGKEEDPEPASPKERLVETEELDWSPSDDV